ncbi:ROK family protein [Geobacter sp. DSM 9736]|uniref:ROK family protein n=1 Tax=Geobacter sp. DSM 9736 TaxID=1277350 RepID=UPI000B5133B8|nr:ROK family protein [Geobacter sp. DSM 9736]SNB47872.1 glucokinase [Geobacter sp. DSM 9736]
MKSGAESWAIGVDLGGTKIQVAQVDSRGQVFGRLRVPTRVDSGAEGVVADIVSAVRELLDLQGAVPAGIGVGVAGQVSPDDGTVFFAPNLNWLDVPLQADLTRALGLPVVVTNDVRAATVGEWLHGAGRGHDDIVCMFVGTGIGGGMVCGGKLLTGCSNNAGEVGHATVDLHGPICHCGNRGCLEAVAGGWGIAHRAQEAVMADPDAGKTLMELAEGRPDKITTAMVGRLALSGDPLCLHLLAETAEVLGAGAAALVNAFNPCCLILGGGVIEGIPDLVQQVEQEVHRRALRAAVTPLQVVRSVLGGDAGVVGAASLALSTFAGIRQS